MRTGLCTMSSSSQSLSFPSLQLLNAFPRNRVCRARATTTAAAASATSSPFLSEAVGVIGGVSASATFDFLQTVAAGFGGQEDEQAAPPFVACRDPSLFGDLFSSHEEWWRSSSSSLSHGGGKETKLVENLRRQRLFLESSGVKCIALPCQICHRWHREISDGCSVPFLHVGDCVAEQIMAAKLRPVEAGRNVRIGVLPSDAAFPWRLYQEKLQSLGLEVVLPDKATIEHTVLPALEALRKKDIEGARTLLRIALQVLLVGAVNTIVLASDDMRTLIPPDDPLWKRCIDPVHALARSALLTVAQSSGRSRT